MYLSYSGYKTYCECPRLYCYRYIWKTPLPTPDNKVNMLFGSVVGVLFERFYEDKMWRSKTVIDDLTALIEPTLSKVIAQETRGGVIRWKDQDRKASYESREELIADIKLAIPRGIEIIRKHRLIGADARAEVKLDSNIKGHLLAGRADFIMTRVAPESDLVILDGKGSKFRDKYVDEKQLLWYAGLYRAQKGVLVDRLGFVFWRFDKLAAAGTKDADKEAVDWFDVTAEKVDALQAEVLAACDSIEVAKKRLPVVADDPMINKLFPAKPEDATCKFCSFQSVCPQFKQFEVEKAAAKKAKMGLPSGVTEDGFDGIGLED